MMIIGVPKEIKNNENRVAITPAGVVSLIKEGHQVLVEAGAGVGSGFPNEEYASAGAKLIQDAATVWSSAEMVMKVKEPLESEYPYFRPGLILFTYLHLAPEPSLAAALKDKGVFAIGYETVVHERTLPLLTPMSEVAGRMSVQLGAQFLQKTMADKGFFSPVFPGLVVAKLALSAVE